ncbi:MAG: acetyl-CoA carboxylase biotin carboxyl carrier protein [Chlamydiales bacterium]|nr:acetyl-CoA carboxylase biotin carboxyl carrier protein [Chlamydiales bacterium]
MDLKQIEKLMAAMERSSIKKVILKREGFEIELEREGFSEVIYSPRNVVEEPPLEAERAVGNRLSREPRYEEAAKGEFVTSPMVGTFYASPSPDDPPFVKVGDAVEEESLLCIIEAMKVMNEVKSGIKGKIAEILVKNGDPVEFGSKIFRIEP